MKMPSEEPLIATTHSLSPNVSLERHKAGRDIQDTPHPSGMNTY